MMQTCSARYLNQRSHASLRKCWSLPLFSRPPRLAPFGRSTARWSAWFDGFHVSVDADGTTVLRGPVADQSALHGLLAKVRDQGLASLSEREKTTLRDATEAQRRA